MAVLLLRGFQFLRFRLPHHQRFTGGLISTPRRLFCRAAKAPESSQPEENVNSEANVSAVLSTEDPPKYFKWDDPDYRKWKDKEDEILSDIEPIVILTKEILHSHRYMDGERLTVEDEKAVVEKLLAYHPHSEDKIGCGLDSIMVDRHPQFRHSRCLFVVRTDGGWIDFSYQKCLRAYVRDKYPTHAERFIREHFKRGSG
ncbi:DNA-directed RNA polymerase subunit [Quillaja saponaria]|uniref:DNA-directed RNA polymerase subunit n=1 Tax=Quillaja saponaria TaxID=32244 RepID=A0AAD7LYF9_QUISA|nr:DNA-directed RNA polymerase subunit [Quillaja saponaria]